MSSSRNLRLEDTKVFGLCNALCNHGTMTNVFYGRLEITTIRGLYWWFRWSKCVIECRMVSLGMPEESIRLL